MRVKGESIPLLILTAGFTTAGIGGDSAWIPAFPMHASVDLYLRCFFFLFCLNYRLYNRGPGSTVLSSQVVSMHSGETDDFNNVKASQTRIHIRRCSSLRSIRTFCRPRCHQRYLATEKKKAKRILYDNTRGPIPPTTKSWKCIDV